MSRPVQAYLANQVMRPGPPQTRADFMRLLAMKANAVSAASGQQ